ncbi:IclR family transcriptional regulator [Planosporangium flavigriseum]|uniref:IclR family transcriptional regulator n=1 Tax=Planosporangium flavigriseum TaxID=373681 RepID=A0A8J3PMZ7_9ACTN|nr:IclR family transcriptional regulator [Planosporangium flavigriseum]NJC65872.1 IclR family transcriptional regulator [Planosporangium flavigriseum]GIG76081.1 IclR family transcriptional regulator [Planosporangium flavigriseum]
MDESHEQGSAAAGVRSVTRALQILSRLTDERTVITLRELQDETGLARTTLIRLVATLEDHGLLWAVGGNRYAPGPGLLRWARLASSSWELPLESRRALRALVETAQESASVWVRQGVRRVCVAQEESLHALRTVVRVGHDGPLWAGPTARVLIRDLPDDDLAKIAAETPDGAGRLPLMRQWQAEVREQGYAVSHGEREDALSVIAVPLVDKDGAVTAALTLAGPTGRFGDERLERYLSAIREAAEVISASGFMRLGASTPSPR